MNKITSKNEDDPHLTAFRAAAICVIILALLSIMVGASYARSLQAYNIEVEKDYVKSTGRCTCSLQTTYSYQTRIFMNYCPGCHHYGCLEYEVNQCPQNREGMWRCKICDRDYCLVHGKEHISGSNLYLIPYKLKKRHVKLGGSIVDSGCVLLNIRNDFFKLFTAFTYNYKGWRNLKDGN